MRNHDAGEGKQLHPGAAKGWILAGVVAVALAVGWCLYIAKHPEKKVVAEEVLLRDIVKTNGLIYKMGSSKPLTGILASYYGTGELQSKTEVFEGRLNGVSTGWYTNGVVQVEERFADGISDGIRRKWYSSGTAMLSGEIKKGQFEGRVERWHTNGVLSEVIQMKHGKADGESWSFYPSGYRKSYAVLSDGVVLRQESWKDGELNGSEPIPKK